ncbi:MAG: sulfurtransferase, partial [Nitrosopumilus sp.]|nr:sulfurtransferase [Nitrosopumilus sp.]
MFVTVDWLKEHQSDPDVVIVDTRPKTMFLYGHLPNSQSLSIEQVIRFDEFGSNLVIEQEKIVELFSNLGIDETKTVILIG